ncbi:MAG: MBL fold metallo-hydrolase [Fibrobacteres bacterium]|nr:MBL fold metallo-hydrolase [Fibrobacterota bacterium]
MKITFLGTGSSSGTPVPTCSCHVCTSRSSKDRRYRPSLLVESNGKTLVIDAPQELRLQLVKHKVMKIDCMLITHCHADHVYGLDDVRIYCREKKLPVYADSDTVNELKKIFPYVFRRTQKSGGKPRLQLTRVDKPFSTAGFSVIPLPVFHGGKKIFGWRIGGVAYIPDTSRIPESTFRLLEDLDIFILDGLRKEPHPTHITLGDAVKIAERVGAGKTYFTHISHNLQHKKTDAELPKGMHLAFDGLVLKTEGVRIG